MYKLFNKLFGWHYVTLHTASDHVIRRVSMTKSGYLRTTLYGKDVLLGKNGTIHKAACYVDGYTPLTWEDGDVSGENVIKFNRSSNEIRSR